MTIYKYLITPDCTIPLPDSARILCLQVQHELPYIWVLLDPNHMTRDRQFQTIATGERVDTVLRTYIGTFQLMNGGLVFHVFTDHSPK